MTLTDSEKKLIKAIGHSEFGNGQICTKDNPAWVDCIWGFEGKRLFAGVMASLSKKGLAETDGECCWLTEAGVTELAAIDAAAQAPTAEVK
jgi:hypothetical protein